MFMISYIPINLNLNGVKFHRYIEYNSRDPTNFRRELRRLTWEVVDILQADEDERKSAVEMVKNCLLQINEFWYDEIFLPVSLLIDLPTKRVCNCHKGFCQYDFFYSSHYAKDGAKVKVDIFTCPPSISLNAANQTSTDIQELKDFYVSAVRRYQQVPCCQCLPLSKDVLLMLESLIVEIKMTLDKLCDEIVNHDKVVIV